jgi:hypothetical protein
MKMNKSIFGAAVVTMTLLSCGDKMDYNEYTAFDHAYIDRNFEYVGGFMTTIYNDLDTDLALSAAPCYPRLPLSRCSAARGNAIEDFLQRCKEVPPTPDPPSGRAPGKESPIVTSFLTTGWGSTSRSLP